MRKSQRESSMPSRNRGVAAARAAERPKSHGAEAAAGHSREAEGPVLQNHPSQTQENTRHSQKTKPKECIVSRSHLQETFKEVLQAEMKRHETET